MTSRHVLADGTAVVIRPLLHSDRFELAAAYTGLSAHSRRLRFFAAPDELEPDDLEYLTSIDYHSHFAFAAFLVDGPWPRGIGVARYVRDPAEPTAAEVAVTVTDAYQHRGLGTLLMRRLTETAITNGVHTFVSYVLWENTAAIALLTEQGARALPSEPGVARIELDLPNRRAALADSYLHHILRTFADAVRDVIGRPGVDAESRFPRTAAIRGALPLAALARFGPPGRSEEGRICADTDH
jgi:RimJ/RimL family protein N-acetyltransferase